MIIKTKDGRFVDVSDGTLVIEADGSVDFTPHGSKKVNLQGPQEIDTNQLAARYEHAIVHQQSLFEL